MTIGLLIGVFILGGVLGVTGLAVFSYGPKTEMERERSVLVQRLNFLEHENAQKRFKPIKDPRVKVHELVN